MIFPRRVRAGTRLVLLAAFALIAALALPGAAAVADGPPGVFCSDTGSASQRTQVHGAWTFSPNCFAMGGPGLTYTVTAGAATPNGFGQVVYTPSADNVGDDQFTVRADNGQGGTASATIFLHVSPPGPPMCQQPDAALSARPGRQVATMPNCVMNGPQNEDLGFVFVSPPVDGKAWVNQYGALVYRGAHNGDESFTVRPVGSQTGQGDPIIVTVHTGDDLNSPPSCSGFGGFGAIARAGVPTPIAAGCSDSDGDPMSVSVDPANPAAHRAISDLVTRNNNDLLGRDAGPGFTYTAPADAADSSDDFKVLVDDGHGGITPVSFHVQILSPSTNHAPSCFGGSELTITPGQTSSLAMFCSDGDGDPVDVSVKAGHGPSLGGLEPDNYSFVGLAYTAGSATGDDSFTLTADDHHGGVVDIPAVVHVVAPSKPTCTRSTEETSVRSGKSTGVGFGFSCDANGPISIQPIGTPSSGTLTPVTFSGQLFAYDYRADAGISAPTDVTLQFKAVNGGVESDVLTTTVHVDPAFNTPPDCFVESGQPAAGAFVGSSLPVRAGTSRTLSFDCFDAEGDRATLTASAGHGSAPVKTDSTEIGADGWRETRGSILYTPSAGYVGADKVTLTADDGHPGGSSTASNRLAVEDAAADSEPSCMVSAPNTQTGSKSRVVLSCSDDDNDTLTLAADQWGAQRAHAAQHRRPRILPVAGRLHAAGRVHRVRPGPGRRLRRHPEPDAAADHAGSASQQSPAGVHELHPGHQQPPRHRGHGGRPVQ